MRLSQHLARLWRIKYNTGSESERHLSIVTTHTAIIVIEMTGAEPGTYALLLKLDKQERITVGKLGTFDFPAGYYLYVGSALGPGGLRARLARHRRSREGSSGSNRGQTSQKLHWHIDYLLQRAQLVEVWSVASEERLECQWSKATRGLSGAQIPVRGLGSSDCRCPSHLIYFSARPNREQFQRALRKPGRG
jgi:Uri superfamily endonuclease